MPVFQRVEQMHQNTSAAFGSKYLQLEGLQRVLVPIGSMIGSINQVEGFRIYNQMTTMLGDIPKPVIFSHVSSG